MISFLCGVLKLSSKWITVTQHAGRNHPLGARAQPWVSPCPLPPPAPSAWLWTQLLSGTTGAGTITAPPVHPSPLASTTC